MVGKRIVHTACGDDFTVVATAGTNYNNYLKVHAIIIDSDNC